MQPIDRNLYPTSSLAILGLLAALLATNVGCVALNVPSDRFHDSGDSGGMFGGWPYGVGDAPSHEVATLEGPPLEGHALEGHALQGPLEESYGGGVCSDPNGCSDPQGCSSSQGCCLDGGPLDCDPFDHQGEPAPPEIPWPRFHPVPTRPVFGAPEEPSVVESPSVASLNGPIR